MPLGDGLPVAGGAGTLERRLHRVAGRRAAAGKTGTLGNAPYDADPPAVKSLSGLPAGRRRRRDRVRRCVLNAAGRSPTRAVYRPIWDAFADLLATYPPARRPPSSAPLTADGLGSRSAVDEIVQNRRAYGERRWRCCRCSRSAACCCPGGVLPLHVFEPRYRQLVIDCLADDAATPSSA